MRAARIWSSVAVSPSMIRAGSPGVRLSTVWIVKVMPSSTGMAHSSRRIRYEYIQSVVASLVPSRQAVAGPRFTRARQRRCAAFCLAVQPDCVEPDVVLGRVRDVALHVVMDDDGLAGLVDGLPDGVGGDQLEGVAVRCGTLFLVEAASGQVEQAVACSVGVVRVVGVRIGPVEGGLHAELG